MDPDRRSRKLNAKYFGDEMVHTTPISGMINDDFEEVEGAVGGRAVDRDELRDISQDLRRIEQKIAASVKRSTKSATSDSRRLTSSRPKPDLSRMYEVAANSRPTIGDLRKDSNINTIAREAVRNLLLTDTEEEEEVIPVVPRGKVKSGLDIKSTDTVVKQVLWLHLLLQNSYVTSNLGFSELSLPLLVAGELEILSTLLPKDVSLEFRARLEFLKLLAYEANSYPIKTIAEWYAAYMRRIELGRGNWGGNFYAVGQPILAKYQIRQESRITSKPTQYQNKDSKPFVYFCSAFNKGSCDKKAPHETLMRGKTVKVEHICAICWLRNKVKKYHPEGTHDCPHYKE